MSPVKDNTAAMETPSLSGMVFDIQKFSIHDGPGIRTTVFLKGCPLRCLWCHNPESHDAAPEVSLMPGRCIGCGHCQSACPHHCHTLDGETHLYNREACMRCGRCAEECHARAIELIGQSMSVDQILAEVEKDRPFYETSGGGMTLSGGEPLFQFEFTLALLQEARRRKLHTCLETSGFAAFNQLEQLLPLVDLFLFDYKETDPARHMEYTGVPRDTIADNLVRLDQAGAPLILRCPIIPGLNARDDHFAGIAALANRLRNLQEVHLMPYHPMGRSKNERLGKPVGFGETSFPSTDDAESWRTKVASATAVPVRLGN
jgi:glycyl-radical enzyme activating protein